MANSYVEYTAAGGTAGPYSVPFLYLKKAHVVVTKDGVVVSDYTWTSASQITFNANVTAGVKIKFARNTPETPLFNSADGNVLTDTQLKVLGRQAIYLAEETNDASNDTLALAEAAIAVAEDAAAEVAADTGAAAASAVAAAASAAAAATAETNAETAETNAEAAQAAAEAAQLAAEAAAGSLSPSNNIAWSGNNTHSGSETFTGDVSVLDSKLIIKDDADPTKIVKLEASGVTTGTTRTLTVPDADITIAGRANAETLENKTIDGGANTLTKVPSPGSIFGLEGSTVGSSTTLTVSAGRATDSTHAKMLLLSGALAKTTSAWAAGTGNGGLDTGTIANSTWYHWYVIAKADLSAVDVVFSTNASAPTTLPTDYTLYRRIFSWKTNGSAQWATAAQYGDVFYIAPVNDWFPGGGFHSAALRTLSIPTGIVVRPLLAMNAIGGGNGASTVAAAPASNSALLVTLNGSYEGQAGGDTVYSVAVGPHSNTSAQIYMSAGVQYGITVATYGWIDSRGKE